MKHLVVSEDIIPLGEFKARAARILEELRERENPLVVTQNGRPACVVLSPAAFDRMRKRQAFLESVAAGLEDRRRGPDDLGRSTRLRPRAGVRIPRRRVSVRWTRRAQLDLIEIGRSIARERPEAGWIERLRRRARRTADHPWSGRIVPERGRSDVREVIVGSDRVAYRTTEDGIVILTVFEGHRLLPPGLEEPGVDDEASSTRSARGLLVGSAAAGVAGLGVRMIREVGLSHRDPPEPVEEESAQGRAADLHQEPVLEVPGRGLGGKIARPLLEEAAIGRVLQRARLQPGDGTTSLPSRGSTSSGPTMTTTWRLGSRYRRATRATSSAVTARMRSG